MKSRILLLAGVALLIPAMRADHPDFVVVSATASKAYTQKKCVNGVPQPETYVFYQGKYFEGLTHDSSITQMSFMDIAHILAPNLAKQNYLPTKDVKTADLLIVVDWGTTVRDESGDKTNQEYQALLQDEQAQVLILQQSHGHSIQAMNQLVNDQTQERAMAISIQKIARENADLLGYTNTLNKETSGQWASANGLNSDAESHLSDLNMDRYFIILQAYDYQKILRDGKTVDAKRQPVWSVRMNIRADGNNFTEALPAMSRVAADFFGKQEDDLKTKETNIGKYQVEIGLVKVIKTGEDPLQK